MSSVTGTTTEAIFTCPSGCLWTAFCEHCHSRVGYMTLGVWS